MHGRAAAALVAAVATFALPDFATGTPASARDTLLVQNAPQPPPGAVPPQTVPPQTVPPQTVPPQQTTPPRAQPGLQPPSAAPPAPAQPPAAAPPPPAPPSLAQPSTPPPAAAPPQQQQQQQQQSPSGPVFGPTIIERSERRETYPPGATESAPPGVRAEARAVAEPRPEGPAAFSIIARDALYGGATGVLVGGALLLITRDWDEWDKFLGISTGAGVLLGASVGVVEALARRDSVADAALRPPVRPELSPSEREAADARARTASLGWGRRF